MIILHARSIEGNLKGFIYKCYLQRIGGQTILSSFFLLDYSVPSIYLKHLKKKY